MRLLNVTAGCEQSGPSLQSTTLAMVEFTACIIRSNISCVRFGIWFFGLSDEWYETVGQSLIIFLIVLQIGNSGLKDVWWESGFEFLSFL